MARLKGWRAKIYRALTLAIGLLLWQSLGTPASEVKAFTEPVIQHAALECIPNNQFAIATAVIEPGNEIRTARMYFRSDKYPDFYYVDMEGEGSDFQAVFPLPSEETEQVIYYVEAVSVSFDSARTPEHDPIVAEESECKRRDPVAAWFTGENPGLVVGATVTGAPPVPPGFQAMGIAGFVTSAGVASGAGGSRRRYRGRYGCPRGWRCRRRCRGCCGSRWWRLDIIRERGCGGIFPGYEHDHDDGSRDDHHDCNGNEYGTGRLLRNRLGDRQGR